MKKTIKLERPITMHGKTLTEIGLNEPTGMQFIQLGEPVIAISTGNGGGYLVEQPKVIQDYFDLLIDHENGSAVLTLMGFSDARKLKKALFSFFHAASETPTEAQPAPSSSI